MLAAAAIGGSAIIGGITSMIGSSQAAKSADKAANLAQARYTTTRGDLQPYNTAGQNLLSLGTSLASDRTGGGPDYVSMAGNMVPPQMTQAELEQTPGYQFTRDQGLKAVQSSAAARSLGVSGAALKGAAGYATGLANQTYKDQFNIAQQRFSDVLGLNTAQQGNLTNQFARVSNLTGLGENAAAQTGNTGATLANTAGNALIQSGVDTTAGFQGVNSAVTGGLQSYLNYSNYQSMIDKMNSNQASGGIILGQRPPGISNSIDIGMTSKPG
jgi:hypothetical protein